MAREWRKYRMAQLIRCSGIMQSLMVVDIHNDLHAHVPPIPPPSADGSRLILNHLEDMPRRYTPLDVAKSLRTDLRGTEAGELSTHLGRQIPFLELSARALKRRHI